MIYTHVHPDLDALASAWLARRLRGGFEEVRFVSASWPGPVPTGDLAVDIACGLKGSIDPSTGAVSSAFALLLELPEAAPWRGPLAPLAELVEAQDTSGRGVEALAGRNLPSSVLSNCLPTLLEKARASLRDDRRLFDWAAAIFDGLLTPPRETVPVRWFGQVALVEGGGADAAFRQGARIAVYRDGWNVGAVRNADENVHLGRLLEPWIRDLDLEDGWFFHSAGFLACHGSRKAPAERPCPLPAETLCGFLAERLSPPAVESQEILRHPGRLGS